MPRSGHPGQVRFLAATGGTAAAGSGGRPAGRPAVDSGVSVPASSAPTLEYRQHDVATPQIDTATFRPGWMVRTRLLGSAQAGRIGSTELDAADRWRAWCEAVGPRSFSPLRWLRIDRSAAGNGGLTAHRLDAAARLRDVAVALGADRILFAR